MSQLNGNYNGKGADAGKRRIVRALRVLSIGEGQDHIIMTLADRYGGLFTHFKRRSFLCRGPDCPATLHNSTDTCWKGYTPILAWDRGAKVWVPFVLEITEALELDFRDQFARGQIWEVWRDVRGKRASPVQGKLLPEARDPATIPEPFDITPVLQALYHCTAVALTHKNPLPSRVLVEDVIAEAPEICAERKPATPVPGDFSFADEFRKRRDESRKSPLERKEAGK